MQISREKAIELGKNVNYNNWSSKEIFLLQISQEKLLMSFKTFHEAAEEVLDRPVYTEEFVDMESLLDEFLDKQRKEK